MKGKHRIIVWTKRIRYDFTLRRNITVIRGDSATGKTTLIDMIQDHLNNPSSSPVGIQSDIPCYVIEGAFWKNELSAIQNGVVFIDEGNDFIASDEFAREIQHTDNYYVIVTREGLANLPYSIEEIYGIRNAGKYGVLQQTYNEFYHIYGSDIVHGDLRPDLVITEDSNSGYDFFKSVCEAAGIACKSAGGKSNMFRAALQSDSQKVLLIADGAAFGAEMDRIQMLIRGNIKIACYLPESFEWLILRSGLFESKTLTDILLSPFDYIECKDYFSWERFFTSLLMQISSDGYLRYQKRKLNPGYLQETARKKILSVMEKICLTKEE